MIHLNSPTKTIGFHFHDLSCLQCKSKLENAVLENQKITCSTCNAQYPILGETIPIFMEDSTSYLTEMYMLYGKHMQIKEKEISRLRAKAERNIPRANSLHSLADASHRNLRSLYDIQELLLPSVSPAVMLEIEEQVNQANLKAALNDFNYLKRDWTWLPEGENELQIIFSTIQNIIDTYALEVKKALVMGAGAGRLSCELTQTFQQVYATDKSFSMVYHFHQLLKEDFYFYETTSYNVGHRLNLIRELRASLIPPNNGKENSSYKKQAEKVNYFVADALSIPLPDASLSCFFSVYFTDIIALKLTLPEIKRVLKEGGLFIHYGPLGYAFTDPAEMLTPDEIKADFIRNGFEIVCDTEVISKHNESALKLVNNEFKNWVFAAIKRKDLIAETISNISKDTILGIKGQIQYEIHVNISNLGQEQQISLYNPDGQIYEGADTVVEILKLIDGKKNLEEVIKALGIIYDLNGAEDQEAIVSVVKNLVRQQILYVV